MKKSGFQDKETLRFLKEGQTMFCFQCQEASKGVGCTIRGVCGKTPETAQEQDLLIWSLKALSVAAEKAGQAQIQACARLIAQALFATITNANFDEERIRALTREALSLRDKILPPGTDRSQNPYLSWTGKTNEEFKSKASAVGVLETQDEDLRSLKELVTYGLKGVAAYAEHAAVLGFQDPEVNGFFIEALSTLTQEKSVEELVALTLKTGQVAVAGMALLDKANTSTYGHPEVTKVELGVRGNPGILISGHDLKDLEELLQQTEGTGIDVYTHSEMLPAHAYPAFKKYAHFAGNYGSSWWHQDKEFESFHGPILMTTNCIVPPKESYKARLFTTGMAGYPGCPHIEEPAQGKDKDFTKLIEVAKTCLPPQELETGTLLTGFAHDQVAKLADKVVAAVKSGAIKKFIVMAGCDGRFKEREYFTGIAQALPQDAVILTAGCAKYRYNKLNLGDIGGIPRVLDAGQCNDSYSLALTALKLKEVFALADVNDLPLAFDIAWYEQKAVAVLLALLFLGFKKIRLGPTLPAFLSPNVTSVLVKNFGIQGTTSVEADVEALMA
jgi:hydroxylamine reductase